MYVSKVPHRRCSYLDPCTRPALCTSTRADAKLQAVQGRKTPFFLSCHSSLSRSLSLSRAALSLTRLSLSPRYLPLRLPSRIVSGSFRPIIRPSLFLGPLPQCIPHRTQHGFSSVVRFLSGYISSGTSARVWPLDLYFPSFSSPPPSRLLFFPFPFASGHLLSCEANWYPNGSGVFLTLFVSSVYPPLQDPRPEFGVSLPVVSFF